LGRSGIFCFIFSQPNLKSRGLEQSQIVQNGIGRCVEMGGVAVKPTVHTASMDGFVSPDNIWLDHRTPYIRIWLSDTICNPFGSATNRLKFRKSEEKNK
jgi:hypothetical protein